MIKSDAFYRCFEVGLIANVSPALLQRSRGKIPKYRIETSNDSLSLWFKVNGKASAIPYQPGEFWPVVESKAMRYSDRDDGLVSWYQYTDNAMEAAIIDQRRCVYRKTLEQSHFEPEFWRQARDVWVNASRDSLDSEISPRFPHTRLYYLDEEDATQWGTIFGQQLNSWIQRYVAAPETLEMYMWRVHWSKRTQASQETPSK